MAKTKKLSIVDDLKKKLAAEDISMALSTPDNFLSTGNMALNYIMTGNYNYGIPNRRSVMFCGPSGTGKSFLCGNIAKTAQEAGYFVVYIDTENSLEQNYLNKIGVDMSEDKFLPINISTMEEGATTMSNIFRSLAPDEKVMVVIDSLSNMETEAELEQFEKKGEMGNDMGIKAKKVKQLLRNINVKVGERDMFVVYTNHVYQNQDVRNGKGLYIVSGGEGQLFIPSITVLLTKSKLKEGAEVTGFVLKAEVIKSRFTQLGLKTQLSIPWDTGMDPYDGLTEYLEKQGLVVRNGAWYSYVDGGQEVKFQRKDIANHFEAILKNKPDDVVEFPREKEDEE